MTTAQPERDNTDDSLRSERSKTDAELEAARAAVELDADRVLERARERAEEVLSTARKRTDSSLASAAATERVAQVIESERADEDRALASERASADERLQIEREARTRALASLLDAERGATDEDLLVERARADRTVATRDEFLGIVSHDLRGLLHGIAMEGTLLVKHAEQQGDAGSEVLRRAHSVQRFTTRMTRLVGDLLDVVSLEAGQLAVTPAQHSVEQLMQEALAVFQPTFAAKGLTLTAQVSPDVGVAVFDHDRILQVLGNLLGNALKFTASGGHVAMNVSLGPEAVCVSISDDGMGIPSEDLESVFERFRQVKAKDRRGLGLGLYIARSIVKAHGGQIVAERSPEGGTTVRFTLPATQR